MNMHGSIVAIIISLCFFALASARTSDELRVTLQDGSKLVGRTLRSHSGRSIKAYLGIPYAKPPIGQLRFKVISVHKINFQLFFLFDHMMTMIVIQQNIKCVELDLHI